MAILDPAKVDCWTPWKAKVKQTATVAGVKAKAATAVVGAGAGVAVKQDGASLEVGHQCLTQGRDTCPKALQGRAVVHVSVLEVGVSHQIESTVLVTDSVHAAAAFLQIAWTLYHLDIMYDMY